jgi:hypothetical protein
VNFYSACGRLGFRRGIVPNVFEHVERRTRHIALSRLAQRRECLRQDVARSTFGWFHNHLNKLDFRRVGVEIAYRKNCGAFVLFAF